MAVDLRIEKFAVDTFRPLWLCLDCEESIIPRPKDYGNESETDCTEDIVGLILSRLCLFRETLQFNLETDYKLYSSNGIDFYFYISKHITKYNAYYDMNIFDKMFMSCAVVAVMGTFCSQRKNYIYRYTGPLSWAMYFEKELKDEFYTAGEWIKLKEYAETCYTRVLSPVHVGFISKATRNDLETAKGVFKFGEEFFDLFAIVEVFKQRMHGIKERLSCSKCLPLFDVFFFLSNGIDPGEFQLIEGYNQIFLRSLTSDRIQEVYSSVVANDSSSKEETEAANTIAKIALTKLLQERIFVCEIWDSSDVSKRCVFCGRADIKKINNSSFRGNESERVKYLKSIIRSTVSDLRTTETTDPGVRITETTDPGVKTTETPDPGVRTTKTTNPCVRTIETTDTGVRTTKTTYPDVRTTEKADSTVKQAAIWEQISDEIKEKIVLRLFLALGMEPALSRVKANIEAEFGFQNDKQDITNSMDLHKIQEEKESTPQKKTKKNKKKKKRDA